MVITPVKSALFIELGGLLSTAFIRCSLVGLYGATYPDYLIDVMQLIWF
tara:strand:- start:7575 stop:7721 length:147 start_codon:yes stop_codon:yes gene_type:complete